MTRRSLMTARMERKQAALQEVREAALAEADAAIVERARLDADFLAAWSAMTPEERQQCRTHIQRAWGWGARSPAPEGSLRRDVLERMGRMRDGKEVVE